MKIKKEYTYSNKRLIWRVFPLLSGKMVVEERDIVKREAFFNCVNIESGKFLLKNYQAEEKFWIGIESVYKDIILFHKFLKPDLPNHKDIIAFDINTKKVLWSTEDYNFLFIKDDLVYTFRSTFDGWEFYTLNYLTGELVESLGTDADSINKLKAESYEPSLIANYLYPSSFKFNLEENNDVKMFILKFKEENVIAGDIEYIVKDDLLLFSCHIVVEGGTYENTFYAVNLNSGNIIFDELLNRIKVFVPDSFFVFGNKLFLLKEKEKISVYTIKNG